MLGVIKGDTRCLDYGSYMPPVYMQMHVLYMEVSNLLL